MNRAQRRRERMAALGISRAAPSRPLTRPPSFSATFGWPRGLTGLAGPEQVGMAEMATGMAEWAWEGMVPMEMAERSPQCGVSCPPALHSRVRRSREDGVSRTNGVRPMTTCPVKVCRCAPAPSHKFSSPPPPFYRLWIICLLEYYL
jgi:hypothetical protein